MDITKLKICFSGPSGSGKTTMCKHLSEQGFNWESTSAWDVLNNLEKDLLFRRFGYRRGGHRNVIQLGHQNPEFAIAFQNMVKEARFRQLIRAHSDNTLFPGVVLDRSPLDNIAYMFMQSAMYMGDTNIALFISSCIRVINNYVDTIIFIPITSEQPTIENNNSRISNLHYQQYVSSVFKWVLEKYDDIIRTPILVVDTWDLQDRKDEVDNFLIQIANGKSKEEIGRV